MNPVEQRLVQDSVAEGINEWHRRTGNKYRNQADAIGNFRRLIVVRIEPMPAFKRSLKDCYDASMQRAAIGKIIDLAADAAAEVFAEIMNG